MALPAAGAVIGARWALLLLLIGDGSAQTLSFSDETPVAPPAAAQPQRGVLDEIATLDRNLTEARAQREALDAQIAAQEEVLRRANADAKAAQAALNARRAEATAQVGALYRLARRGLARVVFGVEDPTDLRRRAAYLRALLRAEQARLADYAAEQKARDAAAATAAKAAADLASSRAAVASREDALTAERTRREALVQTVVARPDLTAQARTELGAARAGLAAQLATAAVAPTSFRAAYGHLPWPASGRLLRRFGAPADPAAGFLADSLGIDLGVGAGAAFRAVFGGTVSLAGPVSGYGLTVAVGHGSYTTVYAHAASLSVGKGHAVSAGQQLGVAGNSGLPTAACCTLSFEIRYNGTPQDPLPWLRGVGP